MKGLLPMLLTLQTATAERQLTHCPHGHLIHNSQIFSPDSQSIVFDARNDETQLALSSRIGIVHLETGEETTLYQVPNPTLYGPGVGAATFHPSLREVAFIHGLDQPSAAQPYGPQRRSAALVDLDQPSSMRRLDARDVTPPFTPGALRGGTHAHHWSGDGSLLSFTYNDALIPAPGPPPADLRTIGIIVRHHPVIVANPTHPEDFSGLGFTVIAAPVTANPKPGELSRASDEGWVGTHGYLRPDGSRQKHALAFIGHTPGTKGPPITEIFVADLPDSLTTPGAAPLEGTSTTFPHPPAGLQIRRLTFTENTAAPGLQGPRHWVRSSPDGSTIAFLDQDARGTVQIFTVSPNGGPARRLTHLDQSIDTPFSWSPCGRFIAASSGTRIVRIDATSGRATFLTPASSPSSAPRHGVVFSPDGRYLAYNRLLPHPNGKSYLQICLLPLPSPP